MRFNLKLICKFQISHDFKDKVLFWKMNAKRPKFWNGQERRIRRFGVSCRKCLKFGAILNIQLKKIKIRWKFDKLGVKSYKSDILRRRRRRRRRRSRYMNSTRPGANYVATGKNISLHFPWFSTHCFLESLREQTKLKYTITTFYKDAFFKDGVYEALWFTHLGRNVQIYSVF
jgi:hypothetical protein